MDDNTFYRNIWAIIATTLILIIALSVCDGAMTDKRITEMTEAGANPVVASCAVRGIDGSKDILCFKALEMIEVTTKENTNE